MIVRRMRVIFYAKYFAPVVCYWFLLCVHVNAFDLEECSGYPDLQEVIRIDHGVLLFYYKRRFLVSQQHSE